MLIPNEQYWSWFWTDVKWRLIFSIPLILIGVIAYVLKYWYDEIHEQKPLDSHMTKLDLH
jgi:hypothetical protein